MTKSSYQPQHQNNQTSFASVSEVNQQGDRSINLGQNRTQSLTLRNRLLSMMLPTILLTLATVSIFGYLFIQEKDKNQIKADLENRAIFSSDATVEFLDDSLTITELIAKNSLVINSARQVGEEVSRSGLAKKAISNLENIYQTNKLLKPQQQLNDLLRSIAETSGFTDISYTEKHGFNVAYSSPPPDLVQRDEYWWQQGEKYTEWIDASDEESSSQANSFDVVRAIKDPISGQFLGVVKASLPSSKFELVGKYVELAGVANSYTAQIISLRLGKAVQTINTNGFSNNSNVVGEYELIKIIKQIQKHQNSLEQIETELKQNFNLKQLEIKKLAKQNDRLSVSFILKNRYYFISNTKYPDWVAVTSLQRHELKSVSKEWIPLFLTTSLSIGLVGLIISLILARQIANPMVDLATIAAQAASGDLDIRAPSFDTIEIQTLSNSFNTLIDRVNKLLRTEKTKVKQAEVIKNITLEFTLNATIEDLLDTAVIESQENLQADRVIYYRFDDNWNGIITAESLAPGVISAKGAEIYDPCFAEEYVAQYEQGRVQAIDDIYQADLTECHLGQLEPFEVKASLITPVIAKRRLDGLLIAHQCSEPRHWLPDEIELLTQIANQTGFAVDRLELQQQQQFSQAREKQTKEALQSRALELLKEVYDVAEGNLTIRAKVTDDEIGTIADSYNSTIASLQKLVTQVKAAAEEVKANAGENELAVQKLAQEAVSQAEEIGTTLNEIKHMSESIRAVSLDAAKAEQFVMEAKQTITVGDGAMNQTVTEINAIQATVTQTAQKVKRLGESSQEISQAVNLIGRFAAQTHLLALKASIEAARAGEQGKGFAVIADEVRSLATQSAKATSEIDNLVARIQLETNEVLDAMNTGTKQVEAGAELVKQTRQSLTEVTSVSGEISQLVMAIAQAAHQQSLTSERVRATMTNVAAIAQDNSRSATKVSTAIQQLSTVAEKLQTGIGKFKI